MRVFDNFGDTFSFCSNLLFIVMVVPSLFLFNCSRKSSRRSESINKRNNKKNTTKNPTAPKAEKSHDTLAPSGASKSMDQKATSPHKNNPQSDGPGARNAAPASDCPAAKAAAPLSTTIVAKDFWKQRARSSPSLEMEPETEPCSWNERTPPKVEKTERVSLVRDGSNREKRLYFKDKPVEITRTKTESSAKETSRTERSRTDTTYDDTAAETATKERSIAANTKGAHENDADTLIVADCIAAKTPAATKATTEVPTVVVAATSPAPARENATSAARKPSRAMRRLPRPQYHKTGEIADTVAVVSEDEEQAPQPRHSAHEEHHHQQRKHKKASKREHRRRHGGDDTSRSARSSSTGRRRRRESSQKKIPPATTAVGSPTSRGVEGCTPKAKKQSPGKTQNEEGNDRFFLAHGGSPAQRAAKTAQRVGGVSSPLNSPPIVAKNSPQKGHQHYYRSVLPGALMDEVTAQGSAEPELGEKRNC